MRRFRQVVRAALLAALLPAALAGEPVRRQTIEVGGGKIQVAMDADLPLGDVVVLDWTRRAAEAVTGYLGRFPVKKLSVVVKAGGGGPVNNGVTHGASLITIHLGPGATPAELNHDWVMTHEMFHLAFPTLPARYLWMMEGLSDYLEPVARSRAGQITARQAWLEFARGLPDGLPGAGDRGLDDNPIRERIYWGGNLYWLLADIRIREKTGNQRGVEDVIRAILKSGGNGDARWTLGRVLEAGRRASGTSVLKDLYDQMGRAPGAPDLAALWRSLGVVYRRRSVTFDDTAPLARIRESVTAPRAR